MSKLYEALNRGKGEIAEFVLPLVDTPPPPAASGEARRPVAPLQAAGAKNGAVNPPALGLDHTAIRTLRLRVAERSPILPFDDGDRRANEQYRILRTKLSQHPRQPRVIVVASPTPKDGKSVSAVNVAGVLSLKNDAKVLLVDADLRRSSIHFHLGVPQSPGLTDVLSGACTLEEALVRTAEFPNLYVLSAGTQAANPVELLDSGHWRGLAERLRGLFRYTILDSPPVAFVADYDLIQSVSDGVIVVVRPDHTDRTLCRRAFETVPKEKLLGVLLNWVPDWFLAKHTSSSYSYYAGSGEY